MAFLLLLLCPFRKTFIFLNTTSISPNLQTITNFTEHKIRSNFMNTRNFTIRVECRLSGKERQWQFYVLRELWATRRDLFYSPRNYKLVVAVGFGPRRYLFSFDRQTVYSCYRVALAITGQGQTLMNHNC